MPSNPNDSRSAPRTSAEARCALREMLKQRRVMLDAFEKEQQRRETPDYPRNLRIFDAMVAHAVALGALPLRDPLEGIEVDIALARALNVRTRA